MAKRPPVQVPQITALAVSPLPLTLQDSYELALQQSETLAIAKEDIEEAEAQFFIAASEALGDVNFVMERNRLDSKGRVDSTTDSSLTDPDRRTRKFVIKQPLFQGFKAMGALTGAGSLRKEQKEEWLRAKQLLFLDVASAYYGFLREKDDLKTIDEISSLFKERIQELEGREGIGRSRSSEVVTARSRMKTLDAERARVHGTFLLAQHLLEFLTGVDWKERDMKDEALPEEPAKTLDEYLIEVDSRPDVEAARQGVKTAWRGVIVAQSKFWPELSVEHTQYERREGSQSGIDWDFLFKIDVPLFQGGAAVGGLKKAVSLWKKEKLGFQKTRREAERDIKDSYEKWFSSQAEHRALEEAAQATEENFRLQKDDYAHNLVGNLDVLEALEEFYQTRRDATRAFYQMKENYWRLRIASGEIPAEGTNEPL